jgi:Xaa-Pro aminopeptidase
VSAPPIAPATYEARLRRLRSLAADAGIAAVLVGVGPELRWLVGYAAMPLERLTMLVVPNRGRATLVVPRLEAAAADVASGVAARLVDVVTWRETEDPIALVARAVRANGRTGTTATVPAAAPRVSRVLVTDGLRSAFLLGLQAALPEARFDVASAILGPLRSVKDADEIELLRRAAHAADRTVAAIASGRLVGRTEADVAREVRERLVAEGHDDAAFWIVASGPSSASPHHEASAREIGPGEPVVIDIGGRLGGYHSDITRTVWVTGGDDARGPDDEFRRLYRLVQAAQSDARSAVRPGVAGQDLDRAARRVIEAGGLGEAFLHRLGHGIGLEVHEDPYLVEGIACPVQVGNVFSVEPGIYLEGRYGARIEDIVACRADGADMLNEAPRDLQVVSGL